MNSLFDTNAEKESLPSVQRRVECTLTFPTSMRSSHFSYVPKTTISLGCLGDKQLVEGVIGFINKQAYSQLVPVI